MDGDGAAAGERRRGMRGVWGRVGWLLLAVLWGGTGVAQELRVATFNTMLFRNSEGRLLEDLGDPAASGPRRLAEIIQRVNPDVILLNEFDYDQALAAVRRFEANFLAVGQGGQAPIAFGHRFAAEPNTGIASCFDLDNSGAAVKATGTSGYAEDAFGFGQFPGQYGMVVLSKFPIVAGEARTFQKFLWKDMPGALLPDRSITPAPADWYSADELDVFRLSSKSHWDLPIDVGGEVVHLLVAHPTPPTFDGRENRNGLRNHDEIRLWADYVTAGRGAYLYDDAGRRGGIGDDVRFVICGDYNADPVDGDSVAAAINQLLENPAVDASVTPAAANGSTDTSAFGLRVDYVLPSAAGLEPLGGAIFWPSAGQDGADLVGASDHRLVWMDLELTPLISSVVQHLRVGVEGADVVLRWEGQGGITYGVEQSPDLSRWEALGEVAIGGAGGTVMFSDAGAAAPAAGGRRYYRVTAAFAGR